MDWCNFKMYVKIGKYKDLSRIIRDVNVSQFYTSITYSSLSGKGEIDFVYYISIKTFLNKLFLSPC